MFNIKYHRFILHMYNKLTNFITIPSFFFTLDDDDGNVDDDNNDDDNI